MNVYFPSHSIYIRRERNTSGLKFAYSATFTAYQADIQPVEAERVERMAGRIGKTYEAWVDASIDVKEGDQVVSSGLTYAVTAVSIHQGAGLLDHKYLIMTAQD